METGRNSLLLSPGLIPPICWFFLLRKAGVFLCLQAVSGSNVTGV